MDKSELYDQLAARKSKPKDFEPYHGDNGRVNKAVKLFRQGKLRHGGCLLDVGGGIGDLGFAVKDLFEKTIVMDIADKNLEAARAKGNFLIRCDVDRHGLGGVDPGSVTTVVALDFIEHIVDPGNFAKECHRVLETNGHVFVNTPNIQFWAHLDTLVRKGRFPHTSGDHEVYHGGHLAFFTYLDLCDIFGHAGFREFEQIQDDEGYQDPPDFWMHTQVYARQEEFKTVCMRLGNPNLLFKCVKP